MNTPQEHTNQEHGHTKEFTITVNGRPKVVTAKELSFAEIVAKSPDGGAVATMQGGQR